VEVEVTNATNLVRSLTNAGLVAFLSFICLAAEVEAGPFEDATAASERGDYTKARRLLRPLAEKGNAKAQVNVGIMYANGNGVAKDYAEAMKWYRKAADQGHAKAQYNLGVIYHEGQGVPQDYAEAMKWSRKAADQGHAQAQHNLGFMYALGQGVPRDNVEAAKWYRKAADQGYIDAQYNLGLMYANGQGVPQDYVQAYLWLNLTADSIPVTETENHNKVVSDRDELARKMTPAQIAEAQRLAREWKPK
jgi:uncharacterized protein